MISINLIGYNIVHPVQIDKGRNPKKISTKIVKMSLSEEGGVAEIP